MNNEIKEIKYNYNENEETFIRTINDNINNLLEEIKSNQNKVDILQNIINNSKIRANELKIWQDYQSKVLLSNSNNFGIQIISNTDKIKIEEDLQKYKNHNTMSIQIQMMKHPKDVDLIYRHLSNELDLMPNWFRSKYENYLSQEKQEIINADIIKLHMQSTVLRTLFI